MENARFFCQFCSRQCGSEANFEAHVRGKAHRKIVEARRPPNFVPALPAQQVMFDGDMYEEEIEHPRVRTATRETVLIDLKEHCT